MKRREIVEEVLFSFEKKKEAVGLRKETKWGVLDIRLALGELKGTREGEEQKKKGSELVQAWFSSRRLRRRKRANFS